jgi:hypothetical protein
MGDAGDCFSCDVISRVTPVALASYVFLQRRHLPPGFHRNFAGGVGLVFAGAAVWINTMSFPPRSSKQ